MKETTNPNIYYGTATITVDGKKKRYYEATFRPSGDEYEDVNNGKGYVPSEVGAILKAKSHLARGDVIKDESNVTITFRSNTGHAWMVANAVRMKLPEISKDGYDVEYHGAESEEISNG